MKLAYLEDANQEAVSEAIHGLLKNRGALVTEHTHSHIRFEGLNPGEEYSFSKGGYVGTYQHVGEKEVQLRLNVEATVPARIFWRTVTAELVIALLFFIFNPPSNVWFAGAAILYGALMGSFLLYLGTWRTSRQLERTLLQDFLDAVRAAPDAPSEIELQEERLLREFEEELEAEIAREALKGRAGDKVSKKPAKPAAGPRLKLPRLGFKPSRKDASTASSPSIDEKRRRLEELRATVAARRKAAASGDAEDEEAKKRRIAELRAELERRRQKQP